MIYGSIAARFCQPLHVVNSVTGLGYVFVKEKGLKKKILHWIVVKLFRFAFKLSSMKVRFENPDDMNELVSLKIIPKHQGVVIKGVGINLGYFKTSPEPPTTPIVMFASRFLLYKGIQQFVEAASLLKSEGTRARFVLVGMPDPHNPSSVSETQVQEWVNSKNIECWGFQTDMYDTLSQAAIICLPTYYREGIPRILIEACALARPIITTDTPGCRLIASNDNGLLVPPKDSLALANAMRQLIENPALRYEMGKRGRELVENDFTEETVVRQTFEIYEGLQKNKTEKQLQLAS